MVLNFGGNNIGLPPNYGSNFIAGGTTIHVKADGTGDFTSLIAALSSLNGKWSDGYITIEISDGTYTETGGYSEYNRDLIGIPEVVIKGESAANTIINNTTNADHFLDLFSTFFRISDLTINRPNIAANANSAAIRVNSNARLHMEGIINIEGRGIGIEAYQGGDIIAWGTVNLTSTDNSIYAYSGNFYSGWKPKFTFTNCAYGFRALYGGTIHMTEPVVTFTNVTTKINVTGGTSNLNGWITGITV